MSEASMVLTPEGRQAVEAELQRLYAKRPQVVEQIAISRDEADLAESTPYIQAREEQALVEGRIIELETVVRGARVVSPPPTGQVELGSHVVVEEDGKEARYHMVDPFAVDPAAGRISVESPVGRALMGAHPGDTVEASTPSGPRRLTVKRLGS